MNGVLNHPGFVLAGSFVLAWIAALAGYAALGRWRRLADGMRENFGLIVGATLTLLGLIISFSFSMAINRYDQRKNLEEAEANAIGTEIVRAGLLPAAEAAKTRALLKDYLDQRILFYTQADAAGLRDIDARTARLQADLWTAVEAPAQAQRDPVSALVVAGMNDVLNSQGYTQAAWWNRIPSAAWGLMMLIAVCANLLIGYGARQAREGGTFLLCIVPAVAAIAFALIADIDSPRGGLIHLQPQNLQALAAGLTAR